MKDNVEREAGAKSPRVITAILRNLNFILKEKGNKKYFKPDIKKSTLRSGRTIRDPALESKSACLTHSEEQRRV